MNYRRPDFRFVPTGEELGEGGFGRVDKVRVIESWVASPLVGEVLARKRLHPEWAQHPDAQERFEREIDAMRKLSHPSIVPFKGQNLGGQRCYLMPVYRSTVRTLIHSRAQAGDWRAAARTGAHLADGLAFAHGKGLLHRDLKPENVLFNDREPAVIGDWGLGRVVHQGSKVLRHLTRGGMGTEYYCSLEQWSGKDVDSRADVYALGMMLDEWVNGGQRVIVQGMGVPGPSTSEQGAGAAHFNALIALMTAAFAVDRMASMEVVAVELRKAAGM